MTEVESPPEMKRAARMAPETAREDATRNANPTVQGNRTQRLPAFGRQLKAAFDAHLRPNTGGGCVLVTSDWNYARAFDPGRVICPPSESPDSFDFEFLRGIEVVVIVPACDEVYGESLVAHIRDAGARLVVLAVNREDSL